MATDADYVMDSDDEMDMDWHIGEDEDDDEHLLPEVDTVPFTPAEWKAKGGELYKVRMFCIK